MSSSAEAFAQLSKWKSGSAKLYMSWAISGVSGWCIGVLKHVASSEDEEDVFQEVTVRHYPNASPLAPPKKNSQGVVQISDME